MDRKVLLYTRRQKLWNRSIYTEQSHNHIGSEHRIVKEGGDMYCVILDSIIPIILYRGGTWDKTFLTASCFVLSLKAHLDHFHEGRMQPFSYGQATIYTSGCVYYLFNLYISLSTAQRGRPRKHKRVTQLKDTSWHPLLNPANSSGRTFQLLCDK